MTSSTPEVPPVDMKAFDAFEREFADESDRASVILGVAKLDLLLSQILERALRPCTERTDPLLDGDGPLSTFSARITICHRLGLIDDGFVRALGLVRKIRNAFAHEISGCKLETGAHRDRIKELAAPLYQSEFYLTLREKRHPGKPRPFADFKTVLALMVLRLEGLLFRTRELRPTHACSLLPDEWLPPRADSPGLPRDGGDDKG